MTEYKKLLPSDFSNIMGGAHAAHTRRSGAEAVDNAIGGHGIDSVVVDEAARIYPGDLPAATGSGAEIKIDSQLPDVMVGVDLGKDEGTGRHEIEISGRQQGKTAKRIEAEEKIQEIDSAIRANWPPLPVDEGNHPAQITDQGLNSDSAAEGNHPDVDAFEVWIYRKIGDGYGQATRARAQTAEKAFIYAFEEQGEPNVDAPAPDPNTEEYYERLYHVLREAFTTLANEGFDPIEINASACGMARRSMESLVGKDKAIAWDNFVRKQIGWDKAKARIIYPNQVVKGRNGKRT